LTTNGLCDDCEAINSVMSFNEDGNQAFLTCYPCSASTISDSDTDAAPGTEATKSVSHANLDKTIATPRAKAKLKPKAYSHQECISHGTGKERRFCLGCQREGTGGRSLCKGFHGKQKQYCKVCNPLKYDVTTKKHLCAEHDTRKRRSHCFECQKAGNGGGGLCIGKHGRMKNRCKECHPDLYEARLRKQRQKYTLRSGGEQSSDAESFADHPVAMSHLLGLKSNSDSEPLKCLCGHDLVGIDEVHYSICDKCTTDAAMSIN
jgi:hypothetical protein